MKTKSILLVFLMTVSVFLSACSPKAPTWQEQYDLGVRYLSEGNYEEAIIAFTAAIEIDPKRPDAYIGRGDAYLAIGDAENAIADYEVAQKLGGDSAELETRLKTLDTSKDVDNDLNSIKFPLSYQIIETEGAYPVIDNIFYEVYMTDGEIDKEMSSATTHSTNGIVEETLYGSVNFTFDSEQYSWLDGLYYIGSYFDMNGTSARVENCSQYIYGLENGQFATYEEMLQIYGNRDQVQGVSSTEWIDSNEWFVGIEAFDENGDRIGYVFLQLGSDSEIQEIKSFCLV